MTRPMDEHLAGGNRRTTADLQSLHFENQDFVTAISPVDPALALRVEAVDGRIVETPLPVQVLEGRGPIVKGPSA